MYKDIDPKYKNPCLKSCINIDPSYRNPRLLSKTFSGPVQNGYNKICDPVVVQLKSSKNVDGPV